MGTFEVLSGVCTSHVISTITLAELSLLQCIEKARFLYSMKGGPDNTGSERIISILTCGVASRDIVRTILVPEFSSPSNYYCVFYFVPGYVLCSVHSNILV